MAYISKISKNDLGAFIREVRTQKGLALIPLAAKAGCSTSSINMAENHLRNLRSDTAVNVLKALGFRKAEIKELLTKYGYVKEEKDDSRTGGRKGVSKSPSRRKC